MIFLSNILQAIVGTVSGGFRGGQILPTGHTTLTRAIWSALMALMMLLHAFAWQAVLVLGIVLYFTELWISHTPYQNLIDFDQYLSMFAVGFCRGVCYALSLSWWFGPQALWLVPLSAVGLVFSYSMDKFVKSFNIAEYISNLLLWASLAFFMFLPVIAL